MTKVTCVIELENDDEFTPMAWKFLAPDAKSAESQLVACVTEYAREQDQEDLIWGEAIGELLGTQEHGELLARHGLARPKPGRAAVVFTRDYHDEVL